MAAHGQPAAPQADLKGLCLTNACSAPLSGVAGPRSVREAIAAGNARAVKDLGGSPAQAMEALLQRLRARYAASPSQTSFAEASADFRGFADTSYGSTLAFTSGEGSVTLSGRPMVGAIERRAPDGSTRSLYLTADGGGLLMLSNAGAGPGPR